MNITFVLTAMLLLSVAVMMAANTSIGIECYNKNEIWKKEKSKNFNFMIFTLVCAVLAIISAFVSIIFAVQAPPKPVLAPIRPPLYR
jgi:hypothetical protein